MFVIMKIDSAIPARPDVQIFLTVVNVAPYFEHPDEDCYPKSKNKMSEIIYGYCYHILCGSLKEKSCQDWIKSLFMSSLLVAYQ